MSQSVIKVSGVGKVYRLEKKPSYYTLRDLIAKLPKRNVSKKNKRCDFWALRNISFKVKRGEVLGIIGRNGAGKSTLLKILSRITPPTEGKITIKGKVASILEVGTGFHTELTGRENVFLSGAILGMKRKEIREKFDKIVAFSGIKKFIDTPIKRYSSGMRVRLAFSIVVHLDPEILIIDEVLAVGDIAFQRKSLKKMHSLAKDEGRTVLFVSHSMTAINSLCTRVILLEEGKLISRGNTNKIVSEYISNHIFEGKTLNISKITSRSGNGKIKIVDFWMESQKREKINVVRTGEQCRFIFRYISKNKCRKQIDFGISVGTETGQPLFIHYSSYTDEDFDKSPAEGKFVFTFDKFPLAKGVYKMGIRVTVKGEEADAIAEAANIRVENGDFYNTGLTLEQNHSPMYIDGNWHLEI